jgi:hypothetical protein
MMMERLSSFLVLSLAIAGCSSDGSTGNAGNGVNGGTGGSSQGTGGATEGTGGTSAGSGGTTAGTGGATEGTGATPTDDASAAGGSDTGGSGGAVGTDDGGTVGTGGAGVGGSVASGGFIGWYEAEAVPPNTLYGRAVVGKGKACTAPGTIKPGDSCNSGGGQVDWIVSGGHGPDPQPPDGRGGGELQFNSISAPADGMYDVTWWYHCGNNDNFGDRDCGGQTDPPTNPTSGCRPHQIIVNGVEMPGTYHFPCFGGSWSIIRAATMTLPLKAGANNTVHVYATKPRDAADMDALQISAVGQGVPPLLKSNSDPIGH